MTKRERHLLYHFINGIHSGIPLCCVLYFCDRDLAGEFGIGQLAAYRRGPDDAPYVRCDECFASGHVVKIKKNGIVYREELIDGIKPGNTRINSFDPQTIALTHFVP